jgi:predicted GNAT family acetyltransferase
MSAATTREIAHRDADEWSAALRIIDADPVVNCFIAARVERHRDAHTAPDQWRLGGELWIHERDGEIDALCYSGANLVPIGIRDPETAEDVAAFAARKGRRCSSIVGPVEAVHWMWDHLESRWGQARVVRELQPLMVIDTAPSIQGDPRVRRLEPVELDLVFPAAVAMFTEEIGVSPLASDGGRAYRSRVAELLAGGRSFGIVENGRILFKAELGAVTAEVSQVQGVWVDPELRGQGIGTAGMASVVTLAREIAPTVSLYVNHFNTAAIRAYERVGFSTVGAFASVLF